MRHYYCTHCGGIMDEVEATVSHPEIHTELDGSPTEWVTSLQCIYCNADEGFLEEAVQCEYCDGWFPSAYMETKHICKRCLNVDIMRGRSDLMQGFCKSWLEAFDEYVVEEIQKENANR